MEAPAASEVPTRASAFCREGIVIGQGSDVNRFDRVVGDGQGEGEDTTRFGESRRRPRPCRAPTIGLHIGNGDAFTVGGVISCCLRYLQRSQKRCLDTSGFGVGDRIGAGSGAPAAVWCRPGPGIPPKGIVIGQGRDGNRFNRVVGDGQREGEDTTRFGCLAGVDSLVERHDWRHIGNGDVLTVGVSHQLLPSLSSTVTEAVFGYSPASV